MSEGRCETVSISEGRLTISGSEDGNSLHPGTVDHELAKRPKGVKLWLKVRGAVFVVERFFFLDDVIGFEITYILELPQPQFHFRLVWCCSPQAAIMNSELK
ncbi:hypothetical protein RIF29_26084 [Crotalaria pallida]|uniref:Uncharacterized protein n=1 Tax=Crotalaria pallida TaxID=3830 RepID=A0AAN9EUL5_CROPI